MILLAIIASVWFAAAVLLVGLCRLAARGDAVMVDCSADSGRRTRSADAQVRSKRAHSRTSLHSN